MTRAGNKCRRGASPGTGGGVPDAGTQNQADGGNRLEAVETARLFRPVEHCRRIAAYGKRAVPVAKQVPEHEAGSLKAARLALAKACREKIYFPEVLNIQILNLFEGERLCGNQECGSLWSY